MKVGSLTNLSYRQDGKYRFELTAPFRIIVPDWAGRIPIGLRTFKDQDDTIRAVLHANGEFSIRSGYAWDGCSPALKLGRWWMGTPTPPETRAACLVHDALYQFLDDAPWSRAEADAIFLALMKSGGFALAPVYYGAVRTLGGLHHFIFR